MKKTTSKAKNKKTWIIVAVIIVAIILIWWWWKNKNTTGAKQLTASAPAPASGSSNSGLGFGWDDVPDTDYTGNPLTIQLDTDKVLRRGVEGAEVKELQKILNDSGWQPRLVEDGVFGAKTEEAVSTFLLRNNITLGDLPQFSPGNNGWSIL